MSNFNLTPPSEAQRREITTALSPEQRRVLLEHGTEAAFCGVFLDNKRDGAYTCGFCGLPLFRSSSKFDSGTGWPSFWQPLPRAITTRQDTSLMMVRTEVLCRRCGGHLGHVFDDGPPPTGLRYCMNGLALRFVPSSA